MAVIIYSRGVNKVSEIHSSCKLQTMWEATIFNKSKKLATTAKHSQRNKAV